MAGQEISVKCWLPLDYPAVSPSISVSTDLPRHLHKQLGVDISEALSEVEGEEALFHVLEKIRESCPKLFSEASVLSASREKHALSKMSEERTKKTLMGQRFVW